jgi:PAS domain S-box-containing protein
VTDARPFARVRFDSLCTDAPGLVRTFEAHPPFCITFVAHGVDGLVTIEGPSASSFLADRVHPDDRPETFAQLECLYETGHETLAHRLRHGDGSYRSMRGELTLIREAAGCPIELIGIWIDVTEHVRAEEELRASEQRYRELFENARDVIFTTDLHLHFTSLNGAGEAVTGYTSQEARQLSVAEVVPREYIDKIQSRLQDQLAGRPTPMLEAEVIAKDGRRVPLEINTRLIYRAGRPIGVQGIARDVSERRALEAQMRQAQKMEAVGRLAGGIAHDFNNLLTVILGYTDDLAERFEQTDPDRARVVSVAAAANRAADLTRQLLAFSRRQILAPKVISLNSVVAGIGAMIERIIGEDIQLSTDLAPDLWNTTADPGQIEQVVMNLVVNARDAMPAGGRLRISTANADLDEEYASDHPGARPGPHVMLAVSDTGCGMDAETRACIFEPFFTTKEAGKGTGLGLSTVYGIVTQSGGNIWVDSEPGSGSVFKVYLPNGGKEAANSATRHSQQPLTGLPATILLVEDDRDVRRFVQRALVAAGHTVLAAGAPADARRAAIDYRGPIDLLLTDVVMPDIGGRLLAEALLAERPEMKVLYMSGYTNDAIVQHGVFDSSVQFIAKPFTARDLAVKVRQVLDTP